MNDETQNEWLKSSKFSPLQDLLNVVINKPI